jgi:hypothetical protein
MSDNREPGLPAPWRRLDLGDFLTWPSLDQDTVVCALYGDSAYWRPATQADVEKEQG